MEGLAVMRFLNRNERYFVTQPNMYARGILFGKMKYELGDHASVRCPETGLEADIEFKVKGWVSGSYNAIGGVIKDKNGKSLFELSGLWNEQMYAKNLKTGKKELLFDAAHSKPSFPQSRPLEEQGPTESQRLWDSTTRAIKKADQKVATDEKSKIEDEQRRIAAERGENHVWQPRLFRPAPEGDEHNLDWIINAQVDDKASPEKQVEQILAIAPIVPGQKTQDASATSTATASTPASAPSATATTLDGSQSSAPPPAAASIISPTPSAAPISGSSNGGLYVPAKPRAIGDLIDFDAAPNTSTPNGAAPHPSRPGDPVVRMDSMGHMDTFTDAEP